MKVTVRLFLPIFLCFVLGGAGCTSPQKKMAQLQQQTVKQNSRRAEEMRMRTLSSGEAASTRGAEVIQYDPEKVFDPSRSGIGTVRPYNNTGTARTGEFRTREARVDAYQTRPFGGLKANAVTDRNYATREAGTSGKHVIPKAGEEVATKAAATSEARDANKLVSSRELVDARRPYLGPESKKMDSTMDAKELANWRNAGESVTYSDGTVGKFSTFKQLSIEDVRELLNKNK
jgi:hypothetical protein